MFKIGEKVVYPAHGVGEIQAIRSQVISGAQRKFYLMRILETDMKIMIPVDNIETVGLRRVIDKQMVSRVYKVLRKRKVEWVVKVANHYFVRIFCSQNFKFSLIINNCNTEFKKTSC